MRTPSFSYMGGKAKLRGWLMEHFPKVGRIYGEPFVGRGNVLWEARKRLSFDKWIISDLDTSFFRALRTADLEQLPDKVTKETFGYWKTAGTDIACLIESRISFAGKGYPAGFIGEGKPGN